MKYVIAFAANRRGPMLLGEGATRASVSAECRQAALDFMSGVASGWSKRDLALWLIGPYANATRYCAHGERTNVSDTTEVDAETIEDLLVTTRGRLVAALENSVLSDGALDFADEVVERGFVQRAIDEDSSEVWVPVDRARMRLEQRVGSLFVADYLNDRRAYGALHVCSRCENVVFDQDARVIGMCSTHRNVSGIVTTREGDGVGEDGVNKLDPEAAGVRR